ncbi:AAA family ATPase [Enterobacter asburiae]|uniref:AAA family ATPase n=1 Tax=Enterobacter asburiae TaxID=61645 RepID=UPI0018EBDB30|nr:AAA family ATPase [Enterobacter asburiae]MBJ6588695.1 AAA family ATPase [Enterobacter asburiae]HAS1942845.1 AAA family ATPase [Enterobacter asburiae]
MDIEIRHCNNINRARITLTENKLNIKFAPNGTGKSTLSRAISCAAKDDSHGLQALMPFRLRGENPDNTGPEVTGADGIGEVMCFNEEYVGQFTFQPDELISNSFNILIRNEAYAEREREIEEMTQTIRAVFTDHTELNSLIDHLQELSSAFKLTSSGISRSSTGMKGLSGGNKIQHIPAGLENYQPYIRSERRVEWIDWQTRGLEFSPLSEGCCPFCTGDTRVNEAQIRRVSEEYDKTTIKNLTAIIKLVENLGSYLTEDAKKRLLGITMLQNGPEAEHIEYLVALKRQTDTLTEKLTALRSLNAFSLQEHQNVRDLLTAKLIDLRFFPDLQCELTQGVTDRLNAALQRLINLAGPLQGSINQHRDSMQRLIAQHKTNINNFLTYAGYKYRVDIVGEGDQRKLRLRHIDFDGYVNGGSQHLSYGERNAFAIVLFMYECLSKNPGLIILDDPISSFDKNKKFAILEMLFRRASGECLKNRTVLMLTHDVEPVIDTLKSVRKLFSNLVTASCLRLSDGVIEELPVNDGDIMTFLQICRTITASAECEEIIKLIYLRRYFEIVDERGDAYQILSNLFHRRAVPLDHREPAVAGAGFPELEPQKVQQAQRDIQEFVDSFDYHRVYTLVSSPDEIKKLYRRCRNGYEKLQVFRLLELDQDHPVIRKFVNETYHIENEFICQLDPSRFDLIPEYVIVECDKLIALPPAANLGTIARTA